MHATVASLGRYPVKSMLGEAPATADVTDAGLAGDRGWGVLDEETSRIASAKHPRIWGQLLGMRARYPEPGQHDVVEIGLPDGSRLDSRDDETEDRLSQALGRRVRLVSTPPAKATYDELWPDIDGMAPEQFVADTRTNTSPEGHPISTLPVGMLAPGTFQDVAPVTVLTTASLRAGHALWPAGDWDPRRFRPTLLIDIDGAAFVEQQWVGRSLRAGGVTLELFAATPRCVMVTSPQEGLPEDIGVLRTLARHNRAEVAGTGRFACLGVYATVATAGTVSVGDEVTVV
jgi:uncharacterized protein YcbX